jgi:hypothetical protein
MPTGGLCRPRSRRPSRVQRSGAACRASISAAVRKHTTGRSQRFGGIASTRLMWSACSGACNAA